MLSIVTTSSTVQSPTIKKNVQTTSSLASWSSKPLAPSNGISCLLPPPPEHTSTLSEIKVQWCGITDGLRGSQWPLALNLRLLSQQSNALHVDPRILGVVTIQFKPNLMPTKWIHHWNGGTLPGAGSPPFHIVSLPQALDLEWSFYIYINTFYHSHPRLQPCSYYYHTYAYEAKRWHTCPYTNHPFSVNWYVWHMGLPERTPYPTRETIELTIQKTALQMRYWSMSTAKHRAFIIPSFN